MRNAAGFLSITATVWSPDSSRAASSEPTRPQPMITTCTRRLPVGGGREPSYRVLDGFFARERAGLNGFFAPAEHSRVVSALRQPTLQRPPSAPAPSRRYQSVGYRSKKLLLGPALETSQLS